MNFVHFPKLHDYALDPDLDDDSTQLTQNQGGAIKLSADRHVTFPGISQNKGHGHVQDAAKQDHEDQPDDIRQTSLGKLGHSSTRSTFTHRGKPNWRGMRENEDDLDTSRRTQFLQRWRELPLPVEGISLASSDDNSAARHSQSSPHDNSAARHSQSSPDDNSAARHSQSSPDDNSAARHSQSSPDDNSAARHSQSSPDDNSAARHSQSSPDDNSAARHSQSSPDDNSAARHSQSSPDDNSAARHSQDTAKDALVDGSGATSGSGHPVHEFQDITQDEGKKTERTNKHISPFTFVKVISPGPSKSTLKNPTTKQKTDQKGKLLHKFKRVAVAVLNVLKLARGIIKPSDSPSALLKTFTTMSREPEKEDHSENMKSYGLHFDPSYFRANKEITISNEAKSILRLAPSHRSPEQIQTAMFGLQSLPSFAEYPLHMQEKLTKVAWHEIVTPMRTIIKQGHFAENFYFILAGQAVVTIAKPGETSTQTAAIMRKGTSFGELALLHHSRRTATVTSHDIVQLLSVGREDFFDIFMAGHGRDQIPDHIKFISQMAFMEDWPLERLVERPDQCLLHFFKRNMVIVKDSKISDWLYVVKSGSCRVLKQLDGVSGTLGPPTRQSMNLGPPTRQSMTLGPPTRQSMTLGPPTRQSMTSRTNNGRLLQVSHSGLGTTLNPTVQRRDVSADQNLTIPVPGRMGPTFSRQQGLKIRDLPAQQRTEPACVQEGRPQLPVFVQIELLKPKDVFGLDLVNFNNSLDPSSPSVSLVSLGAECIMLSKSFFVKHANERVKKRLSETVRPYPDQNTMQDSLQTKVNWELYKKSTILDIMAHKHLAFNRLQRACHDRE